MRVLILGAGTAGTILANRLRKRLPDDEWTVTVVEPSAAHHYQPGYLFIPFGMYEPSDVIRPSSAVINDGIDVRRSSVRDVFPDEAAVVLEDGERIEYDDLIIATGTSPRRSETPGLDDPDLADVVHDFYTLEGAMALREAMEHFEGGRLVVHINEMPIKCPVAPLEFAFLADAHLTEKGLRDQTEIVYVTPLDAPFTKPIAADLLGHMLDDRKITVETDFMTERIAGDPQALWSYDEREIPFDLLVTVPVNMGAEFVTRAGLGDELNHVRVDPHTFQSEKYPNIFAIGDAANLPISKAGSVAHFSVDVFMENFMEHIAGEPMTHSFDGHANCFVESGFGKAMLIDFNYDVQPLPGKFPIPKIGPFSLLEETRANHLAKLGFKWAYWNMLLPGREMPLKSEMSMAGKIDPTR